MTPSPEQLAEWKQEALLMSPKIYRATDPTSYELATRCIHLITALLSAQREGAETIDETFNKKSSTAPLNKELILQIRSHANTKSNAGQKLFRLANAWLEQEDQLLTAQREVEASEKRREDLACQINDLSSRINKISSERDSAMKQLLTERERIAELRKQSKADWETHERVLTVIAEESEKTHKLVAELRSQLTLTEARLQKTEAAGLLSPIGMPTEGDDVTAFAERHNQRVHDAAGGR